MARDGPAKAAETIQASRNSVSWKHVSDQGHCWAVVRAEKLRSKVNLILTQSKFKMSGLDSLAKLHTQLEIEYWRLVSGRAIIKNFLLIKSMQIKVSCHVALQTLQLLDIVVMINLLLSDLDLN